MSLESATAVIRSRATATPPLGHAVMFDLGSDGIIYWDGSQAPPVVDNIRRDAETTIVISLADLEGLANGSLNPTMAYMTGKLQVQGSLGVAMKISQILED